MPDRTLDRRALLGGGMLGGMLTTLGGFRGASPALPSPANATLAQILDGAHALVARHLQGEQPNDEAWVHGATALFAQVDAMPPDPFGEMTAHEKAFLDAHSWTYRREGRVPEDGARPAVITHQIHVAPGGTIPLHDHRGMFGAILCADGDLEIRSFDVVAGGADSEEVTLQESTRQWLRPGRFSLLTRTRDNVHEFRAGPKGARVLDLFVWLHAAARSHDLAWVDDATKVARRYRARWV